MRSLSIQKKDRRKIKVIFNKSVYVVLVLINLFLVYFIVFKTDLFLVKEVILKSNVKFADNKTIESVLNNKFLKKNVIFLRQEETVDDLKSNFPTLKAITLKKQIPNRIYVYIEERVPVAKGVFSESSYLIDEQGYVLGYASEDISYPVLHFKTNLSVGTFLDDLIIPSFIELNRLLSENQIEFTEMKFEKDYLSVTMNDLVVKISVDKSKSESIMKLKSLLDKFSSEGKEPLIIDLRYDKISVSFRSKE